MGASGPAGIGSTYEFTLTAELDPPQDLGQVPGGRRLCFGVRGGQVTGHRIHGKVLPGGSDWMLLADGWGGLDVRLQIQTDSGALINARYRGVLELTEAFTTGRETAYDDQYFRCAPELESGDPEFAWVNTSLFISRGRIVPGGVEYEVCRVD